MTGNTLDIQWISLISNVLILFRMQDRIQLELESISKSFLLKSTQNLWSSFAIKRFVPVLSANVYQVASINKERYLPKPYSKTWKPPLATTSGPLLSGLPDESWPMTHKALLLSLRSKFTQQVWFVYWWSLSHCYHHALKRQKRSKAISSRQSGPSDQF